MRTLKLGRATLWAALALMLVGSVAYASYDFIIPVSGTITSTYYSSRDYGNHGALDIAGNNGKAIGAARLGRVVHAGVNGGYGKLVIVDHGYGFRTYYAHMSSIAVHVGQRVGTNQVLGYVGSTGHSTGPHCHFEIRKNGVKQAFPPYSTGVWVTRGRWVLRNW
ncbi:MAG: M23 family metallopeptidase [Planctomycetes bacterium]|nr:M23 family metallopeptidase [Planctomycetota bacterium]